MAMTKFIETIFQESDFEQETDSFEYEEVIHHFTIFIKGKSAYAVIEIKSSMNSAFKDFLTSYQSKLFEAALASKKFKEELKKNSYLLVLVEKKVSDAYQRKFFINIEEDPFFFKKYILRYSEEDLKALTEKIAVQKITDGLGQLAVDHKVFNKFSDDSKNRAGYEGLLYQLYVKIPALSLPTKSKNIGNLSLEIQNKLIEDNSKDHSEKIWNLLEKVDEKSIDLKIFNEIIGQL